MSSSLTSFWVSLATSLPLYLVWLVGTIAARVLWRRHPGVSAALAGGLCALLLVSLVQRTAGFLLIENAQRGGRSIASLAMALSVLGIVSILVRTAGTAAVLAALFGWREAKLPPHERLRRSPFQFSILGMLLLTLAVAILCAVVRALIGLLGESAMFLLQLVDDVPLFVCLLVGIVLAIGRWRRHPQVSLFAAIGISLVFTVTLYWQLVMIWMSLNRGNLGLDFANAATLIFSTLGWILVLIAALGWRDSHGTDPAAAIDYDTSAAPASKR